MLEPTNEKVDYAGEVSSRLKKDYAVLVESVASVLERLRKLPKMIEDEAMLSQYGTLISEGRALDKRLTAYHEAEKAPYLGGGRGVDSFFFGEIARLSRRKDTEPAGGLDVADARVDDYMQRLLMAEQVKRQQEAAEAARVLRIATEKAEAERQAAAEAAAAAERARKPENIAAHQQAAETHAMAAHIAASEVAFAAERAQDAHIDTLAKPADMVRTRLVGGGTATIGQTPSVEILDVTKLDKAALWPFLKDEHILMALKAWAKTKSHKTPMAGAVIGMRNKGQIKG